MNEEIKEQTLKHLADNKARCEDGPWNQEPDRVEFKSSGFPCLVMRGPTSAWCGYCGISPDHPFYGKDYNDIGGFADVHGGLTYAQECQGGICHIPEPGEPEELYWLGFDCAHLGDITPESLNHRSYEDLSVFGASYKDIKFVIKETEHLAKQLAEVERK